MPIALPFSARADVGGLLGCLRDEDRRRRVIDFGEDHVELVGKQRGDDAVPVLVLERASDLEPGANRIGAFEAGGDQDAAG